MIDWNDDNSNDWLGAEAQGRAGMDLADRGLQSGDASVLSRAASRLRAAIEIHPDNADWHAALGRVLDALGEYPPAIEAYQAAIGLDASDLSLFERLASVLCRVGRFSGALETLDQLLAVDPTYEPAYCIKVAALTELGRHEEADETYYLARLYDEHCPRCDHAISRSLILRGTPARAVPVLRRILETGHPTDRNDAMALLAVALEGSGRLDEAKSAYNEALSRLPRDPTLLVGYARLLDRLGDTSAAGDAFRQAVERCPDHAPAHHLLARWLLKHSGPTPKVETHANAALTLDPTLEGAHTLIARCRAHAGDVNSAMGHLTREAKLRPSDPSALFELAEGFERLGAGELAGETYTRLLAIDPLHLDAWQNLAAWHLDRGNVREGLAASYRALRLSPANPQVLYNLALGHLRWGMVSEANGWMEQLRLHHPQSKLIASLAWRVRLARIRRAVRRM